MRLAILYLDALQGGGYPRDIRWLAGALARQGLSVSLVAAPGPFLDGLGSVRLIRPDDFGSHAREVHLVHVWMLFVPGQLGLWRRLHEDVSLVISPAAHLMPAHLKQKWWKKYPYLIGMAPALRRHLPVAHLFSDAERAGAHRWLHAVRYFDAPLGLFPVSTSLGPSQALGDYLLFLGRNDVYQKGIDVLVRGYAASLQAGLTLPLLIAGQSAGDSPTVLRRLIADLGLTKMVELIGGVSEDRRDQLIAEARCLVFLSRWDGPPRPIREAIALGTPVIVSTGTNLGDLVDGFGAGRSVDLETPTVAAALLEAQDDPTSQRWRAGTASLRSHLTWDRVAGQYRTGYELALD